MLLTRASGEPELKDFVRKNSVLIGATFDHYMSIFRECLEATSGSDQNECERDLVVGNTGASTMSLEFEVPLKVFSTVTRLECQIPLHRIDLKPLDVAEAKIRDLEDEIHELRQARDNQEAGSKLEQLELSKADSKPLLLEALPQMYKKKRTGTYWKVSDSTPQPDGYEVDSNRSVQIARGGTYALNLSIQHENFDDSMQPELQLHATCGYTTSWVTRFEKEFSTVLCVVEIKANDKVIVRDACGYPEYGSTLLVVPLK